MAHPVGGDIPANVARAKRWLAYLYRAEPDAVHIAPWIHDLEALPLRDDNPAERELGLIRCQAAVLRCDAITLVGGRISDGMRREMLVARAVIDLTPLGKEPPSHPLPGDVP